jgi:hypothetical protein
MTSQLGGEKTTSEGNHLRPQDSDDGQSTFFHG